MVCARYRTGRILPGALAVLPRHFPRSRTALNAFRLSAGTVWPVAASPIADGAILVDEDGRITAVGPDALVPRPPAVASYAAPDCVLLPGLVNVHTHLELSHLGGSNQEDDFFQWIQRLRRTKTGVTPDAFVEAALSGIREAWAAGITTVADTGDSGAAAQALTELGARGIAYQEVFGPHPDQADGGMAALAQAVERQRLSAGPRVRIGVSPHAPYTVSPPLFQRVAEYARNEHLPLAVHLAESRAETSFVSRGDGPFAELWRSRGIPLPGQCRSPVSYLDALGVLGPGTLVIHAVQADRADLRVLARRDVAVALCPRSNLRHGHGPPPFRELRAEGVRHGVGTDSVVSIGPADLVAEARVLAQLAQMDSASTIRLVTLDGARALGLEHKIGSLEVGKEADVCLMLAHAGGSGDEIANRVLEAGRAGVQATWVAGRLVYGRWPRTDSA